MQTFINTLPGYVFFKDIKGRYQIANQRLLDSFKHDSQELIGSTDEDIFPHQLAEEYQKNDMTVITSKKPLYIEEDVEITPGIRIPHSTRKVPFLDEHGQVIGLIGLSVDISELKKAHHALEESSRKYYPLFELGWEAIFLIEKGTGNILEANSAASEMYGYSHDELLKMRYQELSMTQDIIEKINNKNLVKSSLYRLPIISEGIKALFRLKSWEDFLNGMGNGFS
jgi:PAS domain S-box